MVEQGTIKSFDGNGRYLVQMTDKSLVKAIKTGSGELPVGAPVRLVRNSSGIATLLDPPATETVPSDSVPKRGTADWDVDYPKGDLFNEAVDKEGPDTKFYFFSSNEGSLKSKPGPPSGKAEDTTWSDRPTTGFLRQLATRYSAYRLKYDSPLKQPPPGSPPPVPPVPPGQEPLPPAPGAGFLGYRLSYNVVFHRAWAIAGGSQDMRDPTVGTRLSYVYECAQNAPPPLIVAGSGGNESYQIVPAWQSYSSFSWQVAGGNSNFYRAMSNSQSWISQESGAQVGGIFLYDVLPENSSTEQSQSYKTVRHLDYFNAVPVVGSNSTVTPEWLPPSGLPGPEDPPDPVPLGGSPPPNSPGEPRKGGDKASECGAITVAELTKPRQIVDVQVTGKVLKAYHRLGSHLRISLVKVSAAEKDKLLLWLKSVSNVRELAKAPLTAGQLVSAGIASAVLLAENSASLSPQMSTQDRRETLKVPADKQKFAKGDCLVVAVVSGGCRFPQMDGTLWQIEKVTYRRLAA